MSNRKIKTAIILFLFVWLDSAPMAHAQGVDDVLGGFDNSSTHTEDTSENVAGEDKNIFEVNGSFTLASAYNYAHKAPEGGKSDYRGLSRLRTELALGLDIEISDKWKALVSGRSFYDVAYAINGRDGYTNEVLDRYEKESEFRDVYIQGTITKSLDIKIGRQIIVWGKSDNARVTDVLNPLDNREPGMVDIEDLRLPVTATKLDYYFDQWNITGIAIHEIRFNKNPAYGSDFYPFNFPQPEEDSPDDSPKNWEYALAINGIFTGWDASFYYAQVWDDTPYAKRASASVVTLKHSRLKMYGASANWAFGSWLVKTEGAYFYGLKFSVTKGETKGRYDLLGGVEYSGFLDSTLSLEVLNRHIVGYENKIGDGLNGTSEDQFQSFFRYSGDFYNSRLHLLFLVSLLGVDGSDGGFGRFQMKYDVMDALSVTGGVVIYQSGDSLFFDKTGDNDRVFIDLKRSF